MNVTLAKLCKERLGRRAELMNKGEILQLLIDLILRRLEVEIR